MSHNNIFVPSLKITQISSFPFTVMKSTGLHHSLSSKVLISSCPCKPLIQLSNSMCWSLRPNLSRRGFQLRDEAMTSPITSTAPCRFKAVAQACNVAPVVYTSSTSNRRRSFTTLSATTAKAAFKLLCRSLRAKPTCEPVGRMRCNAGSHT